MGTIELVIRLDEESYKNISNNNPSYGADFPIYYAIRNGTPLPKGHGTLKDTDAICKDIISSLGIRDETYLLEAEKGVYKRIKNAQTIIEADKESEE